MGSLAMSITGVVSLFALIFPHPRSKGDLSIDLVAEDDLPSLLASASHQISTSPEGPWCGPCNSAEMFRELIESVWII